MGDVSRPSGAFSDLLAGIDFGLDFCKRGDADFMRSGGVADITQGDADFVDFVDFGGVVYALRLLVLALLEPEREREPEPECEATAACALLKAICVYA